MALWLHRKSGRLSVEPTTTIRQIADVVNLPSLNQILESVLDGQRQLVAVILRQVRKALAYQHIN